MAKPMTHTQFTDLMKKWSIPVVDNSRGGKRWYNHNRNSKGEWGPVYGIGNHHTGAADNKSGRDVLWNGVSGLPGPLCHAGITEKGEILLNGWGRVNHFGLGDDDVMSKVISEKYSGILKPNETNTDGNAHFYGFEVMYTGTKPMSDAQYKTMIRVNAAICDFHDWTEKSSIGHGEWQPGKWDPGFKSGKMMDMDSIRYHIKQAIAEGPKPKPTTPPKPVAKSITVASGDTILGLAKKYYPATTGMESVYDLVTNNPHLLKAGMKLIVPN